MKAAITIVTTNFTEVKKNKKIFLFGSVRDPVKHTTYASEVKLCVYDAGVHTLAVQMHVLHKCHVSVWG